MSEPAYSTTHKTSLNWFYAGKFMAKHPVYETGCFLYSEIADREGLI